MAAWLEGVFKGSVVAPEWPDAGVVFVVHAQPPMIRAPDTAHSVASIAQATLRHAVRIR